MLGLCLPLLEVKWLVGESFVYGMLIFDIILKFVETGIALYLDTVNCVEMLVFESSFLDYDYSAKLTFSF